jgi:hypothetical protein
MKRQKVSMILSKMIIIISLISLFGCKSREMTAPITYLDLNQRKEFLQDYYKTSYILKIQNFPSGLDENHNDYFVVVDSIGKAHYINLPSINPLTITSDFVINK